MAKKRLKLARLTQRETRLLRAMSLGGNFQWVEASDVAVWVGPKMSVRLHTEASPEETAEMVRGLDALAARHFIDKNEQGQYRENQYGAWTEMAWAYHYGGTLIGTAKKVFGIQEPILRQGSAIMYEVSEEVLNGVFHIVDSDDEAYQEYLEELKAKGYTE